MGEVYLDNSATTPLDPRVVEAMNHALGEAYGNPSSLHRKGLEAERLVKEARERLAAALGVAPERLLFTSGGTEANNLAIFGVSAALRRSGRHVITTAIEHASVLGPCQRLRERGFDVTVLPVDAEGRVDPEDVAAALREDTILVSVMYVNNEIGTIQPIEAIGRVIHRPRHGRGYPLFHVDAVQAFGKLPLRPLETNLDLVTVSAHKIHGPKGVGALYVREGVRLEPLLFGGDQERALRPGTENVPGIVGFGLAASLLPDPLASATARLYELRRHLLDELRHRFPDARVNGPMDDRLAAPHIVNVSFPDVRGETLVHALAERGIYVSTGSACHSRKRVISHVIEAINTPRRYREGAIRISLSHRTSQADLDALLQALDELVPTLQALNKGRRHSLVDSS